MAVRPGQRLGQYQIIEQLGRGGMATVYRASQPSLAREVAIKVLPEFFSDDPAFHERFRQEAMSIAKLRHPNVLTVFDSGEADGIAYIVTELVGGGSLAKRLGKPIPVDECLRLIGPVAAALDYAHAQGLVHRDVKPANILLTSDGTPILSDFGLARMTGGEGVTMARLTATGTALGTPEYMAPEQILNSDVGPPADTYALAVTLYEMLTGAPPHTGDTPINVLMARMHDAVPRPRDRNPSLSEAIEQVLLKGLAKEPGDRYASAGEMIHALGVAARLPAAAVDAFAPTAVVVPPPEPPSSAPAPPRSSMRSKMPIVAVGAAALIAAAAYLFWPRGGAPVPAMGRTVSSDNQTNTGSTPAATPAPAGAVTSVTPGAPASVAPSSAGTANAPPPATRANLSTSSITSAHDGLPPHGQRFYSLAASAVEAAGAGQPRSEDTIVARNGGLELTAASDSGAQVTLPVANVSDFVAVLRYVATSGQPTATFRFHLDGQGKGVGVRLPTYLHLTPAVASAQPLGSHVCCQIFDMLMTPQQPNAMSIFSGPLPMSTPASPNDDQVIAISATRSRVTVFSGADELGHITETSSIGGMSLGVGRNLRDAPARLRLDALDLYEGAAVTRPAASDLPPHGRRIYSMSDRLEALAQAHQPQPENTVAVKGSALELTAGAQVALQLPLGVNGLADFVAVFKSAWVSLKPMLVFKFGGTPSGNHAVQLPVYLRLDSAGAGAPALGTHPCCQDFDVYTIPTGPGQPMLFVGPLPRMVAVSPGDEQTFVVSVKGPVIVVYANGQEIGRISAPALTPGGFSLQLQARERHVPAVMRLNGLEIFEQK